MSWRLAPSLQELFTEVCRLYPDHDHSRDGAIGDAAHQATKSGHNPDYRGVVHAVDVDINGIGDDGLDRIADAVVGDPRLWYVIHDRVIRSRTYGWISQPYYGSDPHTGHAHIEIKNELHAGYTMDEIIAAENDTSPWLAKLSHRDKPAGGDSTPPGRGTPMYLADPSCTDVQKLEPGKWTTLQMSDKNTSVMWESMTAGGPVEYSFDARIRVHGLPAGHEIQFRSRQFDADTMKPVHAREPVDSIPSPGDSLCQYSECAGKLWRNRRLRIQARVAVPNVTVTSAACSLTYWKA